MKKILWVALMPAALLLSCGDDKSGSTTLTDSATISEDTSSRMNAQDHTANKMATDTTNAMPANRTITDKDVTEFVEKAASGGMMEVELGKFAAQNAQSQRVKDYGMMMVTDHTAANNELKDLAFSNNITVPAEMKPDHKMHVDMMMKKPGVSFDKAYMDMMVKDHKKDIGEFKKASSGLREESYKAFATKTLPVLQKHLDSAQAIHKAM